MAAFLKPGGLKDPRWGLVLSDLVCLACTVADCAASATALIRDLKKDLPRLKIIAGGAAAIGANPSFYLRVVGRCSGMNPKRALSG